MSGIAPNKSPAISLPDIVRWRFQRAEQPYYLVKEELHWESFKAHIMFASGWQNVCGVVRSSHFSGAEYEKAFNEGRPVKVVAKDFYRTSRNGENAHVTSILRIIDSGS